MTTLRIHATRAAGASMDGHVSAFAAKVAV
jgi:hypothetical protein